jgi:hypothetical protein
MTGASPEGLCVWRQIAFVLAVVPYALIRGAITRMAHRRCGGRNPMTVSEHIWPVPERVCQESPP